VRTSLRSMPMHLAKFAFLGALLFFIAWLAKTGHVAYILIMLWIAIGLGYAILDLADYEIVKRERRN
jgi:hypothetical protein